MEDNNLPLTKNVQKKFYEWFGDPVSAADQPLPVTEELQKKFEEWFGDPIPAANPPFTAAANSPIEDLIPVDLSFPVVTNPSIGYPVSVDSSFPAATTHPIEYPVSVDLSFPVETNHPIGDPIPVDMSFTVAANHPIGDTAPVNLPVLTTTDYSRDKTPGRFAYDLRKIKVALGSIFLRAQVVYVSLGLIFGIGTTGFLTIGTPISLKVAAPLSTKTTTTAPTAYISTPAPASSSPIHTPTSASMPVLIEPALTAIVTPMVPSPTSIPSDTLIGLLKTGHLSQVGPLSLTDQFRVYESSLKYIGISTEESQLIGEQVNGPGYGSPDNVCGPLSLAILQEAGIVRPDINPHAFWLLNPDVAKSRKLLSEVFPPDRFENIRFRIPLKKMNWHMNPLYPGDFIYIYAGTGGTFEHMLVVNRVDSDGRAYSVNNYLTPNGFVISEVLLYDPADPNIGIFSAWTARPNSKSGSTGFAGFEVWRLQMP